MRCSKALGARVRWGVGRRADPGKRGRGRGRGRCARGANTRRVHMEGVGSAARGGKSVGHVSARGRVGLSSPASSNTSHARDGARAVQLRGEVLCRLRVRLVPAVPTRVQVASSCDQGREVSDGLHARRTCSQATIRPCANVARQCAWSNVRDLSASVSDEDGNSARCSSDCGSNASSSASTCGIEDEGEDVCENNERTQGIENTGVSAWSPDVGIECTASKSDAAASVGSVDQHEAEVCSLHAQSRGNSFGVADSCGAKRCSPQALLPRWGLDDGTDYDGEFGEHALLLPPLGTHSTHYLDGVTMACAEQGVSEAWAHVGACDRDWKDTSLPPMWLTDDVPSVADAGEFLCSQV